MSIKCLEVAKYLLSKQEEESGDIISNMKLQKLLYYAQGFYLAINNTALFEEDIYAWQYGPVVPEAYRTYKDFNSSAIPRPEEFDPSSINPEYTKFLDQIYAILGQFSAWKLAEFTHAEPPWKETALRDIITHEKLKSYFKTQLVQG
jgi:uncharacterized phage-associated protein